MLPALSTFVMMSTVKETIHSGQDPHIIEAHESYTYTFAHIQETKEGSAVAQFAQAEAAFRQGESVGVTVYVYDQPKDIPVMALRVSEDKHGLDVLFRWPEGIEQDAVGSQTQ
jgi:hypothetical protein